MNKTNLWGLGSGLVLLGLAVARLTWLHQRVDPATAPRAELRLWLWLPPQAPDGWLLGLVLAACFAFVWVGVASWRRRRAPRPPTPRKVGSSAFAVDPWTDTAPVDLSQSPQSPAQQVSTLRHVAHQLMHRGRLRAAREVYRQAYDLARSTPALQAEADALLLELRKVERRLEQHRRERAKASWRHWLRRWRGLSLVLWWGWFGLH